MRYGLEFYKSGRAPRPPRRRSHRHCVCKSLKKSIDILLSLNLKQKKKTKEKTRISILPPLPPIEGGARGRAGCKTRRRKRRLAGRLAGQEQQSDSLPKSLKLSDCARLRDRVNDVIIIETSQTGRHCVFSG